MDRIIEAKRHNEAIFEAILVRRSVRSYAPDEVGRSTIQTLLEAAVRAPTAMHEEPWAFAVVQNRPLLKHISDLAKPLFIERLHRSRLTISPDADLFHDAGTLIVICAKPSGPFVNADCWLAAENLMLAACAMGLGSCVIGSAVTALNTPEVMEQLGIPPEYSAVAPIILGIPAEDTPASSRKEPLVLAWV